MAAKGERGQRMFAAVVPPDAVVEHLDEFLQPRREAAEFRWTLAEHFHITLAFLPSVPERKLDDLAERLARAGTRRTAFEARIAGGGAFPNPARSKVLYAGIDVADFGRTELARMATGARAAATRAGLEVDGQRFRPHVTLARMRPTEASNWVRLLETYVGPEWPVTAVEVISSHLGEGPNNRPRYQTVAQVPVGR
jgi:2'-5' RNA ligase